MVDKKNKICAFVHYSVTDSLPYYAEIYLKELLQHFDKIKVLTNNTKINSRDCFVHDNIEFIHFVNKGYDFGMFYRYFINEDLENIEQLAVINDSNILLNNLQDIFQWGNSSNTDFWGIIDSHEKPWFSNHQNNYHIQSHFLVFNREAINKLPEFFDTINIDELLNETDIKKLRRLVIDRWELGLTQFFIKEGLKTGSYISSHRLHLKYKPKKQNLTHSIYHELISIGYPLLKKKVIMERKLFKGIKREKWRKTIDLFGNREWDFKRIIESVA